MFLLVMLVTVWLRRIPWLKLRPTEKKKVLGKKESLGNNFLYFQAGATDCQSTNTQPCA